MGRDTDFNYGANSSGSIADELTPCMTFLVCPNCRKGHGYCSETAVVLKVAKEKGFDFFQEENKMDIGGLRSENKGRGKNTPFLSSDHLPKNGKARVKINEVRDGSKIKMRFPKDLLIDVTIGKNDFTWGLNAGFTLDGLIDALGKNTDKWKGKTISLVRGGAKGQYVNLA